MLEAFARPGTLLAFDFDGTLAPIVSDPSRAKIPDSTRELLSALTTALPCVVISGRKREDVRRRLGGVHVAEVVGNHGIEPWHASRRMAARVARWKRSLQECLAALRGVVIEDKQYSLAVHFRSSRRKDSVIAAVLELSGWFGDMRIVPGKEVMNLLPDDVPLKGAALEYLQARLGCDRALYLGDDDTDEDVFALAGRGARLLGVRVGRKAASSARYFVDRQSDVDRLLRTLVRILPPKERLGPGRPWRRESPREG